MESNTSEWISRSDLALVIKTAAEVPAGNLEENAIPLAEAERIAAEVGVEPVEFRAAVRALRSLRIRRSILSGSAAVLSAEVMIKGAVKKGEAARMLTQAHLSLPVVAAIEEPAVGTWRTMDRKTLIQITTEGENTSIAAVANRRLTKLGMIAGGTWLGAVGAAVVIPALVAGLGGTVEAVSLAQAAGVLGGGGAGFLVGRSAWNETARRTHAHVLTALERMRRAVEGGAPPTEMVTQPEHATQSRRENRHF